MLARGRQYGQNPTKVVRDRVPFSLPRLEKFELHDGDTIVFPKEHNYTVHIERRAEHTVGR